MSEKLSTQQNHSGTQDEQEVSQHLLEHWKSLLQKKEKALKTLAPTIKCSDVQVTHITPTPNPLGQKWPHTPPNHRSQEVGELQSEQHS